MTSKEHFAIAEKHYYEYEETQNEELLEKALKSYSEAIKLQPGFADAYYKRALVNGLLDEQDSKYEDLNTAINIYTELLSQGGNNPELHYKIAMGHLVNYQDNKNTEKALNHFNIALELGYKTPDIFFNIGETFSQPPYINLNDALTYYNKAIDLASNKAEYYVARGDCYDLLKQDENAMVDFSKGIEFDDIEACWKSILYQIIEVAKKLIELISSAIREG
ncbi:tetratricopeptide repeat protein [Pseudobacteroides cellulosolvens]|uniref:Tetratricopeptide repeat-containing protein n=1 Tax=Pseudobacteroides cellulosolvens ATCC 35603 = DSM 2933 TaxID=398512 RepID=A0A0L6JJJ9_9FIRM|nr:tetratricopeptide repeat protein [Pseudobacteroides cellulosolvens]KNY25915.1 Tetratricopeptide repeat-containing protein [Pseudobacteroides cellulosolvens ATCC 35603 = DSM 2933]